MSNRLVQERRERIATMYDMACAELLRQIRQGKSILIDKNKFFAVYIIHEGVRRRVVTEYFQVLTDAEIFIDYGDKFTVAELNFDGWLYQEKIADKDAILQKYREKINTMQKQTLTTYQGEPQNEEIKVQEIEGQQ